MRAPWKAISGKSNYRFEVEDGEGFTVARIVGGHMDGGQAKATLIAAAPDLLAALRNIMQCIATDELLPESVSYMRQARAALAKAVGP
ncbi:MAG TPA: hypothetical protein VGI97_00480 [Gemmatimonadaceae bacterium]|jgi:hypothetical protein